MGKSTCPAQRISNENCSKQADPNEVPAVISPVQWLTRDQKLWQKLDEDENSQKGEKNRKPCIAEEGECEDRNDFDAEDGNEEHGACVAFGQPSILPLIPSPASPASKIERQLTKEPSALTLDASNRLCLFSAFLRSGGRHDVEPSDIKAGEPQDKSGEESSEEEDEDQGGEHTEECSAPITIVMTRITRADCRGTYDGNGCWAK